jgi:hypothetical protein
MLSSQLRFPLLAWDKPYRSDICTELNVERYQLRKDGNISFGHPGGTHDDVFWSLALAVYATVEMSLNLIWVSFKDSYGVFEVSI